MTIETAKRILHPDTTSDILNEIEYYNGFSGKEKAIEAINEAGLIACAAIDEMMRKSRPCLVNEKNGDRVGIFHCFCEDGSKCVIEYPNGELHKVFIWKVQFTDV